MAVPACCHDGPEIVESQRMKNANAATLWGIRLLATAAAGVSGYLFVLHMLGRSLPPGCGSGVRMRRSADQSVVGRVWRSGKRSGGVALYRRVGGKLPGWRETLARGSENGLEFPVRRRRDDRVRRDVVHRLAGFHLEGLLCVVHDRPRNRAAGGWADSLETTDRQTAGRLGGDDRREAEARGPPHGRWYATDSRVGGVSVPRAVQGTGYHPLGTGKERRHRAGPPIGRSR